jgi:poly-gamma-glutamate synthesis protein (capsule biosynthesis protein)
MKTTLCNLLSALTLAGVGVVNVHAQPLPVELSSTVDDGFTLAAVGDIIIAHSLEHLADEADFARVIGLLSEADVATGNLETQIIDPRTFVGSNGGGRHGAEPESAEFLKAMGFDLMARPNNHANDYGPEGLAETSRHLDRAGLQHSGYGGNYWSARAARFVTTSRGRVGMVATTAGTSFAARTGLGEWPGRGGLSNLDVQRYLMIPASDWDAVQRIRDHFPNGTGFYARGANSDQQITLLGNQFRKAPAGVREAYYQFELDQQDLTDILASVREGKMRSDFIAVALHSHHFRDAKGGYRGEGIPEADHLDTNPSVANYLEEFARATIDNGADLFQGTGVHVLRGIEIYRGKPIFYGLGEFIRQRDIGGLAGRGDPTRDECAGCPFPAKYESVVAVSEYHEGRVSEVRLYPVELGYDSPRMAHRGVPRQADAATARRILARLQQLSAPYGTEISIQGDVGYIRP